jgi:histidinol-phosphate aminotransferase
VLVVDEAFADCVRGEPESLATATDVPGLIVVRSLTKTWSIPGLRAGYLLAEAQLVEALGAAQPPWPVSAGAVAAFLACADAEAVRHSDLWAAELAADRAELLALLADVPGVEVNADPAASFVLLHVADGELVRAELLARGFAVRRGDTFPGLGPDWLRVAVRDPATSRSFVTSLKESMCPTSTR